MPQKIKIKWSCGVESNCLHDSYLGAAMHADGFTWEFFKPWAMFVGAALLVSYVVARGVFK